MYQFVPVLYRTFIKNAIYRPVFPFHLTMLDHNIAYGHRHLNTTLDKPVQDYEGLRREAERLSGVPGSAYGGPSSDPRGIQAAKNQAVTTSATVLEGVVHYMIPGTYTYRRRRT